MNPKNHPSERGQALVLIVFGFIVLLGFTALAIDGSMIYSDRRYTQNVADAAALSAAGKAALSLENSHITYNNWNCASSQISSASAVARNAAIDRAASNDYSIDADITDANGVLVTCGVDNSVSPPDKYLDIHVMVSIETSTTFAHLVYNNPVGNTVEAVARVRPRETSISGGGDVAILGLSPEPGCNDSTIKFHGTSLVNVRGGDVHSNGCVRFNGTPDVVLNGGEVYYVSSKFGNTDSDPPAQQTAHTYDPAQFHIPAPNCAGLPSRNDNTEPLLPGRYDEIRINNDNHTMEPGLYCVTNEVHWNGGRVTGNGVTIYVESGYVTINGNVTSLLFAPPHDADPASVAPAVPGLLFYLPPSNNSALSLTGTSGTAFEGVMLAPASLIKVEGTGEIQAFHAMIVGWQVDAGGTSDTYIKFYPNNVFTNSTPTRMELYK